jgi:uncharacterized membrane protein
MKTLIKFLKLTLIGGLLVVVPVWLAVLLLLKVIKGVLDLLQPIAALLPQAVVNPRLLALVLLLLFCFFIGLLMRARPGQRCVRWLEQRIYQRIPGFTAIRGLARQLAGTGDEQSFQPALVEMGDGLVPALIVEKHADGQFTVFVSSSPTPMAGAIYIVTPERVHIVDLPLSKAMSCVTKWGTGTSEMRAAMRS